MAAGYYVCQGWTGCTDEPPRPRPSSHLSTRLLRVDYVSLCLSVSLSLALSLSLSLSLHLKAPSQRGGIRDRSDEDLFCKGSGCCVIPFPFFFILCLLAM